MPERIQRKRTRGWRMPPNTVYVGRPTKWGNPYIPDNDGERYVAVEEYREWVTELIRRGLFHDLGELRGKDLACWCPVFGKDGLPVPCHADVLIELANGGAK